MTNAIDFQSIANAAAAAEDQTDMKAKGSFERPVPEQGKTTCRLLQYIELGKQKAANPAYKDVERVILRFELNGPKHMIEIDTEDGKKKVPGIVDVRLPKGGKDSKYGRLFTALNYSGTYNHFAQMVGAGAWIVEVSHNIVDPDTDKERTYCNLDKNKAWTFTAPVIEDVIAGTSTPVPVPELNGDPKVFLWENKGLTDDQYISLWEDIYIEGEWEAKGDKPARSKNWMQEMIQTSLTFPESRLAKLLQDNPTGVDLAAEIEKSEAAVEPKEEAPADVPADDPLAALL